MQVLLKLLLLGALIGGGVLLFWQNQQPISLTLFAFYRTSSLGLGVWMLLFTLAGIITSLCLRLLIYSPKQRKEKVKTKVPPRVQIKPPINNQSDSVWADDNKQPTPEPWEQLEAPKPPEVAPPPPPSTNTDTTYSYSYVKPTPKQKENITDQVYDAPYRILNQPSPPPEENEEEEEDWV